jgi:hypothetical protein
MSEAPKIQGFLRAPSEFSLRQKYHWRARSDNRVASLPPPNHRFFDIFRQRVAKVHQFAMELETAPITHQLISLN